MVKPLVLNCFDSKIGDRPLDRAPFKDRHCIEDHPALSMSNLQEVIPRLPADQVFFSSGSLLRTDNFDRAHIERKSSFSLEAALAALETSNSYIMVRSPEVDPSFKDLFELLRADIEAIMRRQRIGRRAIDPMLYLFIASPQSLTPFHIDRYSTLLMQLRGRKKVFLYPAWDERYCAAEILEGFVSRTGARPTYGEQMASGAQCFDFGPGEVLHIPFVAPHHVENGSESVSVSLSIIFNSRESNAKTKALMMNHYLRQKGARIDWQPTHVNVHPCIDQIKAYTWRLISRMR